MAKGGAKEVCKVEGCESTRVGWGYCGKHYRRLKNNGSLTPTHRSQARAETIADDGTRKCHRCGERKPYTIEFFRKDYRRGGEDDLKGTCADCLRTAVKRSTLRRNYGLKLEQYEGIIHAQGGKCAICKKSLIPHEYGKPNKAMRPHVDHCHTTGKVRGVLCHHCNVLIGHAEESIDVLNSAIRYLEG